MKTVIRSVALAALSTLFLVVPTLDAQTAEAGTVVVRYWKCQFPGEAIELINTTEYRQSVQDEIDAGNFIDYGILSHNWGDEWNVVDCFVVEDFDSFQTGFASLVQQLQAEDPEGEELRQFREICPDHKDNIYSVVSPPEGLE